MDVIVLCPRQEAPWDGTEKCSGMTPAASDELFFDGPEEAAVSFCRDGCPQINNCLIFALLNNEKVGCWGGMGVDDRKAIRKRWPLRRGRIPRPEWSGVFDAEQRHLYAPGEPASWYASEELADDEDAD